MRTLVLSAWVLSIAIVGCASDEDGANDTSAAGASGGSGAGTGAAGAGGATTGAGAGGAGSGAAGGAGGDGATAGPGGTGGGGGRTGVGGSGGGAGEGEVCAGSVVATCADGLVCCYPCGVPDCDSLCTVPCGPNQPGCSPEGCALVP